MPKKRSDTAKAVGAKPKRKPSKSAPAAVVDPNADFPPQGAMLARCKVRVLQPGDPTDSIQKIIDQVLASPTADEETKEWFAAFNGSPTIRITFATRPGPEPVVRI